MNKLIRLLVYIGLTRKQRNGKWFVPFSVPPAHMFKTYNGRRFSGWRSWGAMTKWKPYVFRNKGCNPHWHNDQGTKRLLPFRWGIGWAGFEFGDRGGEHLP